MLYKREKAKTRYSSKTNILDNQLSFTRTWQRITADGESLAYDDNLIGANDDTPAADRNSTANTLRHHNNHCCPAAAAESGYL